MGISKTVLKNGDGPAPKVGETTTSGYTAYVKETSVPEGKGKQIASSLNDVDGLLTKFGADAVVKEQNVEMLISEAVEEIQFGKQCVIDVTLHYDEVPAIVDSTRQHKPYGCTFLTCNKTFSSKNDWKRHENSKHFHLETWRCDAEKVEGGACAKVCYRRQTFEEHLREGHVISDSEVLKTKFDACRIGRNCQTRFWCGFCSRLVDLEKRGVEAWTERFDHIDDHFMGRHGLPKQSIRDWIPMDSDKPKGDAGSQCEDHSDSNSNGNSSDFDNEGDGDGGAKRKRRKNDSGRNKPAKRTGKNRGPQKLF